MSPHLQIHSPWATAVPVQHLIVEVAELTPQHLGLVWKYGATELSKSRGGYQQIYMGETLFRFPVKTDSSIYGLDRLLLGNDQDSKISMVLSESSWLCSVEIAFWGIIWGISSIFRETETGVVCTKSIKKAPIFFHFGQGGFAGSSVKHWRIHRTKQNGGIKDGKTMGKTVIGTNAGEIQRWCLMDVTWCNPQLWRSSRMIFFPAGTNQAWEEKS